MDDNKNVLSSNQSINTLPTPLSGSIFAMTVRIGMWGSDVFGSTTILGAGYVSNYTLGSLNILHNQIARNQSTLNVKGG